MHELEELARLGAVAKLGAHRKGALTLCDEQRGATLEGGVLVSPDVDSHDLGACAELVRKHIVQHVRFLFSLFDERRGHSGCVHALAHAHRVTKVLSILPLVQIAAP